jgi:outer membrane receptor protein involved in Fe transport
MRVQSVVPWIAVVGTLTSWSPRAAVGQKLAFAARTPRFFYASSTAAKLVEIDVSHNAVLRQVVSLHVEHTTIGGLLAEVQRQTGLTFAYDPHFPATRSVTLDAESITVAAALGAILVGTGVDVVVTPTGHVWLTESEVRTPRSQAGSILGRVTDKATGGPLIGATVVLDPVRQAVTTGSDGRYRVTNLSPGNYTIRARYVGYKSLAASVTVSADQEVTVDFPLEKSAQQLEQIVTTGTVVPTEVKALPSPITVINAEEISQRRPQTLQDVIRQAVPTAVAFDNPVQPVLTQFSVRGVSTLTGVGTMKIFVDGVEAASFGVAPVDPASIERIEVVRGPEAATLYGADAAGGVVQIFTKRGDPTLSRPQVDAQAELGLLQTPYAGKRSVLRQQYGGSLRGGAGTVSYNFGGGYTHLADYLPNGEISRQVSPSAYSGMSLTRGILTADLSARYYVNKLPSASNPLLQTTGIVSQSRPNFRLSDFTNEMYGGRITVTPTLWWRNQLTVGVDRQAQQGRQVQRRLTTPADTLFILSNNASRKISFGYNTSVTGALSTGLGATVTAGIDHYDQDAIRFSTTRAVNTSGTIVTAPAGSFSMSRSTITNTGYFTQAQLSMHDALFLTAGMRAEENSTFGQDLGTPVLPRVGLAITRGFGYATVKVRGAYGRGIRAPLVDQAFGFVTPSVIQLENPLLAPEQQQGWDAGVDVVFGGVGSLSVTGYDQTAKDLIVFVQVATTPLPTFQYQNIGRVANKGLEVEGTLNLRPLQLKAQYGYVRSRIEDLGPGISPGSSLQIGDQPLGTPAHTAGATLTIAPRQGTTLTSGVTYVGSYRQPDFLAQNRCLGGTGPCQLTDRDYVLTWPSFTKVNVAVSHQITRHLQGLVSIDNLTNNEAYEGSSFSPVMGRLTMVGFHLNY